MSNEKTKACFLSESQDLHGQEVFFCIKKSMTLQYKIKQVKIIESSVYDGEKI
jgi:hypothetical protein